MPPPAKVLAEAEVREIVPVPVTVRLVEVAADHAVPLPAIVIVPEPIASVLVCVPESTNPVEAPEQLKLYPFISNVPDVSVKDEPVQVSESCNVTEPVKLLSNRVCVNVLPALVIV